MAETQQKGGLLMTNAMQGWEVCIKTLLPFSSSCLVWPYQLMLILGNIFCVDPLIMGAPLPWGSHDLH